MTPAACPPPARPLPAHGTTACAKTGCTQPECRAARNRYDKQRRYLKLTGRPLLVNAEPAAAHLRQLLADGMTTRQIAARGNISRATVLILTAGQQTTVYRRIETRILAVTFEPAPTALVDAVGTIRRVRALHALGHCGKDIAAATGLRLAVVSDLLCGKQAAVRYETRTRIAEVYEAWSMTVPRGPGATKARKQSARRGWAPPLAWGEDLDDPGAVPDFGTSGSSAAALLEDADFIMATTGMDLGLVAERLGEKRNTLDKVRERAAAQAAAEST